MGKKKWIIFLWKKMKKKNGKDKKWIKLLMEEVIINSIFKMRY